MNLRAWLALLERRHPQTIELGLERCGAVYRRLGKPRPARQVFTVAGTNGKGSTVAFLAALCGAAGQRHGTYTSPHIFRFNERVCVMGEAVADDTLVAAFEQVEAARGEVSLTYFEFTTLAALLILHQAGLDYAILEVGLGGRLDAVNLVDTDCAVITPIGLDHQDYLGPDLDSIATEKAGIIRSGTPVVCTQHRPPAPVLEKASMLGSTVYRRGVDYELSRQPEGSEALQFTRGGQAMRVLPPAMPGAYQLDNLAAALCAFSLLRPDCFEQADKLAAVIPGTRVPGRLQKVSDSPEILLDVGHNTLAAEVVAAFLAGEQGQEDGGVTCVLAMLSDKPAEDVALVLDRVCRRWFCADSPGERGQTGEALAQRLRSVLPEADIRSMPGVGDAMQAAIGNGEGAGRILVFGSFVTVAAAGSWIRKCLQRNSVLSHD